MFLLVDRTKRVTERGEEFHAVKSQALKHLCPYGKHLNHTDFRSFHNKEKKKNKNIKLLHRDDNFSFPILYPKCSGFVINLVRKEFDSVHPSVTFKRIENVNMHF